MPEFAKRSDIHDRVHNVQRVYRVTHPDYADMDRTIEVGRGHPGRFNPMGTGALYVSLDPGTAIAELKRRADRLRRPLASFAPRALLTLDVVLRQVLDLTNESVREAWDITTGDLETESDYTKCHEIALIARRDGYEAIRFPSATGNGVNLVIFYDRRHTGSYVELTGVEGLDLQAMSESA
ncbi:MAG: RES family NAD+ phosphorylase [Gemmatimonadaceae bacterium]